MKKMTIIACLAFVMMTTVASAKVTITDKIVDRSERLLTLKGETEIKGATVSVNIPKMGKTYEDLEKANTPGELIFYSNEITCDNNGKFSVLIEFPENADEGKYTVYLGGEAVADTFNFPVYFSEKSSYDSQALIFDDFAKSDDYLSFKSELEKNGWILGFASDTKLNSNDSLTKIIFDYAKSTGLQKDSITNAKMYNTGLVAELLNEKRIQEAEALMSGMYLSNNELLKDYNAYINDDTKRTYFATSFSPCETIKDFENSFTDALVMTVVKCSDGTNDIKTVLKKYKDYLGVDTDNAGPDDYSYIAGEAFSDINSLANSFNDRVATSDNTPDYSSNKGSGGGSGSSNRVVTPVVSNTPKEINIRFEDLNPVPWAYTAISNLFVKGIINGKSETRFVPNESVKREEFVKMLVQMAGIDVLEHENVFSDVDMSQWYGKYVNTAYSKGIVKGMDNACFGVGRNISRQDMCVMVYNTLKNMGKEPSFGEKSFSDEADFADYSKIPVKALNANGIVSGVGENRFNPKENATRAEAAVIIYNTLCFIEQ